MCCGQTPWGQNLKPSPTSPCIGFLVVNLGDLNSSHMDSRVLGLGASKRIAHTHDRSRVLGRSRATAQKPASIIRTAYVGVYTTSMLLYDSFVSHRNSCGSCGGWRGLKHARASLRRITSDFASDLHTEFEGLHIVLSILRPEWMEHGVFECAKK